jgi:ribosomal protein S18 acetylase RimI-like enzyme
MSNITLKKISITDVAQLQKIGMTTFSETFREFNTPENLNKYLAESFSIEKLSSEINNTSSEFYLALDDTKDDTNAIGYLKVNFGESQTELKDSKSFEIERIYVLKEYQGKDVGQLLYQKALAIAKQNNVEYLWLGVWENNVRAINFYKKNGFVTFDTHIFKLGDEQQTDFMMKLPLVPCNE